MFEVFDGVCFGFDDPPAQVAVVGGHRGAIGQRDFAPVETTDGEAGALAAIGAAAGQAPRLVSNFRPSAASGGRSADGRELHAAVNAKINAAINVDALVAFKSGLQRVLDLLDVDGAFESCGDISVAVDEEGPGF